MGSWHFSIQSNAQTLLVGFQNHNWKYITLTIEHNGEIILKNVDNKDEDCWSLKTGVPSQLSSTQKNVIITQQPIEFFHAIRMELGCMMMSTNIYMVIFPPSEELLGPLLFLPLVRERNHLAFEPEWGNWCVNTCLAPLMEATSHSLPSCSVGKALPVKFSNMIWFQILKILLITEGRQENWGKILSEQSSEKKIVAVSILLV